MRVSRQKVAPAMNSPAAAEGELDMARLRHALWRRKWSILIPTLLVAVVTGIGVNMLTPRYKSEARVLIENRENIFLRPEAEKSGERLVVDPDAVTSQVQLVLSRELARDVIKQLKLAERPEFDPMLNGMSRPATILAMLGIIKDPMRMTPEERVLEAYYARLNAYPVEKSRVISIEFQSADPEVAATVANAVAQGYLSLQQTAKQDQTRAAGQWLSGEIEKMRSKVSEAEANVEQFRSKSNLFVGTNNTTLSAQQLAELNTQLGSARAQKSDAEVRARLIRETLKSGRPIESSETVNSELIRRLSEQRVTLRAQLAEQSSTLLPGHPRIKELRAQISDLEKQIRSEAELLARSLENDAKIAGARMESMSTNLDQLKRQATQTNEQDVQLRALEREAKAQRDLFESYLAKYRETSARDSIAAAPADARIISRAAISTIPFFPKKVPIIVIASLGTFVLMAGFIVTGALVGGGAPVAPARVEPTAPAAYLSERRHPLRSASAPALAPSEMPMPGHTISDLARELQQAREDGRRVALIGASDQAGANFAAIALARRLARDRRVMLIDLALDAPKLGAISKDPEAPGIADLVRGTASFGQIINRDKFSRVHLVTAGTLQDDAEELLASDKLSSGIDALARTYDHVIVYVGTIESASESVGRLATWAALVTPDPEQEAAGALRDQLLLAGFGAVSVVTADRSAAENEDAPHPAAA
jgi:succinoglycan biosynthesis transport protein ExoP